MSEQPSLRERLLATREAHRHSWGVARHQRIASGCVCGAESEFATVADKDAWEAAHEVDAFVAAVRQHITEGLDEAHQSARIAVREYGGGLSDVATRAAVDSALASLDLLLPSPEQEQKQK